MERPPLKLSIVLAGLAWTFGSAPAAQTTIDPDDAGLFYSEYVSATIDGARADFDRSTVIAVANQHSPGTRINFRTDALQVDASFEYMEACVFTGCGIFRLEVDGVLLPTAIGTDNTLGLHSETIFTQATPVTRRFSLILPYASNVDFLGLELTGGSETLGPPPHRPGLLWAAYGDSITQGFNATDIANTYPYLTAQARDWSVVNMGFAGQILQPADAAPLADLGADFVSVAIGTNDYWNQTTEVAFKANLGLFISNFRVVQPDTLLAFIVPPWVDYENLPNSQGLLPEHYRDWMRNLVIQRSRTDHLLVLFEGPELVPATPAFFSDGLHPSNLGFAEYSSHLAELNAVRNGDFEDSDIAWQLFGTSVYDSSQRSSGSQALRIGPGQGVAFHDLTGIQPGLCYTLRGQSMLTDLSDQGTFSVLFLDNQDEEIESFDISVTWDAYQLSEIEFTAPDNFAAARIAAGKPTGSGALYVDELEVALFEPASVDLYGCGLNPHTSLRVLAGRPGLGELLTVGIDNPLGTQTAGASIAALMVALAPDPNFPCGTPVPGFGMSGSGGLGEVLISFAPPNPLDPIIVGPVWNGVGLPAPIDLPIPDDCSLAGFSIYTQGFLFDSSPGAPVQLGFTEGIRLRLGP